MSDSDIYHVKCFARFSDADSAMIPNITKLLTITEEDLVTDLNPGGFSKAGMATILRLQDWHTAFVQTQGRAPNWKYDFKSKHWNNLNDACIEHIRTIVGFSGNAARNLRTVYSILAVEDSEAARGRFGTDIDKILLLQQWCAAFKRARARDPVWENDFSMADYLSLDAADETFPEMMMKVLLYSFRFQNQSLFPIYNHKKHKIFDEDRVMTYAKDNMIDVSTVKTEVISGSSQEEFTKEFGKTLGLEASAVTPLAKSEIKSSRSTSEKNTRGGSKKYSQSRLQVTKKFLRFQSAITGVDALKYFLDEKIFEELLNIKTPTDADFFLNKYGRFYLTQVHIGGLRTYASEDERKFAQRSESRTTEYQNTQDIAKAPVKLGSKFINSAKKSMSKSHNTSEINGTTLGGTAENFASDRETWIASIAEGNYEICQCKFKPMYVLIPTHELEGKEGEQLRKARKLLKESHLLKVEANNEDDEAEHIEDGVKYSVQNQAYDNCYLSPKTPSRMAVGMKVLENFCEVHADQEADRYSDLRISFEDKNQYLGVTKKLLSAKASVSFEEDVDRMSPSNQWTLHQVRNRQGSYFLMTSSKKYMLGLKRSLNKSGKGNEYTYDYVLKKFSKKTEDNTLNFMWNVNCEEKSEIAPPRSGLRQSSIN